MGFTEAFVHPAIADITSWPSPNIESDNIENEYCFVQVHNYMGEVVTNMVC